MSENAECQIKFKLLHVTEIRVVYKGLRYFPDVSCFANLRNVDCSRNRLKTLNLTNATWVYCGENQLITLNLPNTITIHCSENRLTTLNAPNATRVNCDENRLTTLDLPNATWIHCLGNQLTILDAPNATRINCNNNPNLYRENIFAPNWTGISSIPQRSQIAESSPPTSTRASSGSSVNRNSQNKSNDSSSIS